MAAAVVTGIVALLLQKKKKSLRPDQIRDLLAASAKIDAHVIVAGWNPSFDHGKN